MSKSRKNRKLSADKLEERVAPALAAGAVPDVPGDVDIIDGDVPGDDGTLPPDDGTLPPDGDVSMDGDGVDGDADGTDGDVEIEPRDDVPAPSYFGDGALQHADGTFTFSAPDGFEFDEFGVMDIPADQAGTIFPELPPGVSHTFDGWFQDGEPIEGFPEVEGFFPPGSSISLDGSFHFEAPEPFELNEDGSMHVAPPGVELGDAEPEAHGGVDAIQGIEIDAEGNATFEAPEGFEFAEDGSLDIPADQAGTAFSDYPPGTMLTPSGFTLDGEPVQDFPVVEGFFPVGASIDADGNFHWEPTGPEGTWELEDGSMTFNTNGELLDQGGEGEGEVQPEPEEHGSEDAIQGIEIDAEGNASFQAPEGFEFAEDGSLDIPADQAGTAFSDYPPGTMLTPTGFTLDGEPVQDFPVVEGFFPMGASIDADGNFHWEPTGPEGTWELEDGTMTFNTNGELLDQGGEGEGEVEPEPEEHGSEDAIQGIEIDAEGNASFQAPEGFEFAEDGSLDIPADQAGTAYSDYPPGTMLTPSGFMIDGQPVEDFPVVEGFFPVGASIDADGNFHWEPTGPEGTWSLDDGTMTFNVNGELLDQGDGHPVDGEGDGEGDILDGGNEPVDPLMGVEITPNGDWIIEAPEGHNFLPNGMLVIPADAAGTAFADFPPGTAHGLDGFTINGEPAPQLEATAGFFPPGSSIDGDGNYIFIPPADFDIGPEGELGMSAEAIAEANDVDVIEDHPEELEAPVDPMTGMQFNADSSISFSIPDGVLVEEDGSFVIPSDQAGTLFPNYPAGTMLTFDGWFVSGFPAPDFQAEAGFFPIGAMINFDGDFVFEPQGPVEVDAETNQLKFFRP